MNVCLWAECTQGVFVVNPRPSFSDLVARMMDLILNQEDTERAFVPFHKSEDVLVLFVNNMGGMSVLELYAAVDEAHIYLGLFVCLFLTIFPVPLYPSIMCHLEMKPLTPPYVQRSKAIMPQYEQSVERSWHR